MNVQRGRGLKRPGVTFKFDEMVLPNGRTMPVEVAIVRPISGVLDDGPDILLREGMLVEGVLVKDIAIPADDSLLVPWNPGPAATPKPNSARSDVRDIKARQPRHTGSGSDFSSVDPDKTLRSAGEASYKLHVDVDMVRVEAVVRNRKGRPIEDLPQESFRILEDGVEQQVLEFSHDRRPLAVALVIDGSDSVAPFVEELRAAALVTLGQLKREDLVALFIFSHKVNRAVDLTEDRRRIAENIAGIKPEGRTNIYDAVSEAAYYLYAGAPGRRHAIILISDNSATELQREGEGGAVRMALQTETVVYSIQLPRPEPPPRNRILKLPVWVGDYDLVKRIVYQTGGETISLRRQGSLEAALETVISRLKLRYALSYISTNKNTDGRFRKLEIQLAPRFGRPGKSYTVHARRGYYPSR